MATDHAADGHAALEALKDTSTGVEHKKLAMWAFLGSDCMFFGTLISTHLIYRKIYPDLVEPTAIFDIELTGFSSFILLMSSFLMALSVSAAHKGNVRAMRRFLAGTIFFGLIFLGGQVYEFHYFIHNYGLTLSSSVFGSTFYVLTGTHGVHVLLGVIWLACWYGATLPKEWSWYREERSRLALIPLRVVFAPFAGRYKPVNALDVEVAGLYWHFVDIVWIVIFTAVYLVEYL
jgi:heme/copper-type cytochrome/quinol oxidase subunit 3